MSRVFITLVGIDPEQDITKTAVALVRNGYAVVPVKVGGKVPVCTLNSQEVRKVGADHDCGVAHAITSDKDARRIFTRLGKNGDRYNIGVVAGPSRLVIVDADTAEQVEAFVSDWATGENDESMRLHTPTVRTPGMKGDGETWLHKDGGHFYFEVPEGVTIDYSQRHVLKAPGGYDVKFGMSMVVAPPSVRAEGRYVPTGDVIPAPQFLLDMIETHLTAVAERRLARASLTANDDVAAWATSVTWEELLAPAGWTDTGKLDKCGCPIWTKPGGGRTSYKSATAHETDCTQYDNIEGHGPLHLWTTEPPAELESLVMAGTQTITKLQFVAAMEFDGDVQAAMQGLGIGEIDLAGWLLPDDSDGPDDGASEIVRDEVASVGALPTDDPIPDGLTTPMSTTSSDVRASVSQSADVVHDAVRRAMVSSGIPVDLYFDKTLKMVADRLLGNAASKAAAIVERAGRGDVDGWVGQDDDLDDFLSDEDSDATTLLPRTDGAFLLYPARTNVIVGRRGAGKTWLALLATKETLEAGGTVLYYDMEDKRQAWRGRLKDMGCDIDRYYAEGKVRWKQPPDVPDDMEPVLQYAGQFDLVVFDVLNRLITRLGGTPDNGNAEVLWLYDNFFDPLAQRFGCSVLLLDHPNKRGQRADSDSLDDLAPGGGAMKMNNVSGLVIGMRQRKPFTREDKRGHVTLYCLKDRCGTFEEHQPIGEFKGDMGMSITDGLGFALRITPPDDNDEPEPMDVELQRTKDAIVAGLQRLGPQTKGNVKPFVTASLRGWIDIALERLLEEGRVQLNTDTNRYEATDQ